MVGTILNNICRSLSVEIGKFLSSIGSTHLGSKQAFSKARYKLKWEAFVDLNDVFIRAYYGFIGSENPQDKPYRLYAGRYLLLATDGSTYELPYEASLVAEFGVVDSNIPQPICMARGVKIWDILNQITLSSHLGNYAMSEIEGFKKTWLHATKLLKQVTKSRILLLADMYYPSFWLFYQLINAEQDFLFRCRLDFCREIAQFMQSNETDSIIDISIQNDGHRRRKFIKQTDLESAPYSIKVRAIKFTRPNGEISCLVTSVLSIHDLSYEELVALYPYRWGQEESYDFDKNTTQIENFSAKMPIGIRQDWYANTLMSNMAQVLIEEAQEILEEEQKGKQNKYNYKINRSVAIGLLKDEMPKVLFGKETIQHFQQRMIPLILKNRVSIRPNRTYERQKKHKIKFSMNARPAI